MTEHPPSAADHLTRHEQLSAGLLLAAAALILAPMFMRGLACGHDTLTHFYRIAQIASNAANGAPLLLWSPDLMRGYGYTIYPFYAPLSYWATAVPHLLGLDLTVVLRFAAWLMLWLAGWGGYNLARRALSPAGALVAGLAYLFAPYLLYNATQRGAFPELLGLALLPWALTAADRALVRRTPRAIAWAALAFAPLALAHNILPNFGFALLLGLAVCRSRSGKPRDVWTALWPGLAVVALALVLTAFFWLPAYVELDFTQSRRADSPFADWPRYKQHFVDWRTLAQPPAEPGDPALSNPPVSLRLGVGTAVLALFGLIAAFVRRRERRFFGYWALATAVALFLALPASAWLWSRLPLPEFVQLPSRFLGPASLGLALLAGASVGGMESGDWRLKTYANRQSPVSGLLFLTAALAVTVSGWFWLYPAVCAAPGQPTPAAIAAATQWDDAGRVQQWSGDSLGETLPRWVDHLPPPDAFNDAYAAGLPINRLELPDTAVLLDWQPRANGDQYRLQLSQPITLTYRAFYIPYWRANLNGQPATLSPRPGDGLIQLATPAGSVDLSLTFGPTPLRWAMVLLSGIALLAVLWLARQRGAANQPTPGPARREWMRMTAVIILLGLAFFLVDRTNNPIHAARLQADGRLRGVAHPASISFGGEFMYLGYNGPAQMAASETAVFTHYWTAQRPIGAPYRFQLRLADDAGRVWNLPFARPPDYADLPGKPGWRSDAYARDAYALTLLPGTPPGAYWLEVQAFRSDVDLSLMPQGAPPGPDPAWARVGQVQVLPDNWVISDENAAVDNFDPTPIAVRPGLTLLGWSVPDVVWRAGDTAQVDLLWQGDEASSGDLPIALVLTDAAGVEVARLAVSPGGEAFPLAQWPETAVVRDRPGWRLPPELATGVYAIILQAGEQNVPLGSWQINAPPHEFTPPPVGATAVLTTPFASLVGYNLAETTVAPGATTELELVWQAQATADASYRVFVHLLDADGQIVAQSDAVPDNWTRPTTGWLPGEFIRDRHALVVPETAVPGPYTLRVGWYDAASGERLAETTLPTGMWVK